MRRRLRAPFTTVQAKKERVRREQGVQLGLTVVPMYTQYSSMLACVVPEEVCRSSPTTSTATSEACASATAAATSLVSESSMEAPACRHARHKHGGNKDGSDHH